LVDRTLKTSKGGSRFEGYRCLHISHWKHKEKQAPTTS